MASSGIREACRRSVADDQRFDAGAFIILLLAVSAYVSDLF